LIKPEKNITLFAIAVILISLFFLLPRNRDWMAQRILTYWNEFQHQKAETSLEKRKAERYETSYTYSKWISNYFEKKGIKNKVVVLLPPASYFESKGIDYPVPEPVVFYYFTGLKTVRSIDSTAQQATWFVHAGKNTLIIDSFPNRQSLKDSLDSFSKFPVDQ
jgi:hypothetical protein